MKTYIWQGNLISFVTANNIDEAKALLLAEYEREYGFEPSALISDLEKAPIIKEGNNASSIWI